MIVMKFGGSSMASAASISRVVSIVHSHADQHPVVVASAMGDTTDQLLQILSHARRADTYSALKLQDEVKNRHFAICEELLHGERQAAAERYLRDTFRQLHIRMLELADGECTFTPELQDWTASLGEQLSSRLLAEVLDERCGPAMHMDARRLILTTSRFANAEPLYWETYARIRWAVPAAGRNAIVVLGGFIGGTEDGRTTTLGRGGSDLTASIVGAALNAAQIQVWKDVDGMLTCDPRLLTGAHQVRTMTYEEATELARAGAVILHPDTMAPARRLRIPIVIRNTFRPNGEGTTIQHRSAECIPTIKSIAIRKAAPLRLLGSQAILTIVGDGINKAALAKQIKTVLGKISFLVIPGDDESSNFFRLALPEKQLARSLHLLHQALFANPDPRVFIAAQTTGNRETVMAKAPAPERPRKFISRPALLQYN